MNKLKLSSLIGSGGFGLVLIGAALFQFYALTAYGGDLDHVVALGASLIGLGGLMLMASRAR